MQLYILHDIWSVELEINRPIFITTRRTGVNYHVPQNGLKPYERVNCVYLLLTFREPGKTRESAIFVCSSRRTIEIYVYQCDCIKIEKKHIVYTCALVCICVCNNVISRDVSSILDSGSIKPPHVCVYAYVLDLFFLTSWFDRFRAM